MGRKKKTFGKLDANIGVQLTPQQKERLIEAATADQKELSEWVRSVLFAAADNILGKEDH